MDSGNVPIGFGLALAMNESAMEAYAAMTETQKQAILSRAHQVKSKKGNAGVGGRHCQRPDTVGQAISLSLQYKPSEGNNAGQIRINVQHFPIQPNTQKSEASGRLIASPTDIRAKICSANSN